jgi:hypothetical protein
MQVSVSRGRAQVMRLSSLIYSAGEFTGCHRKALADRETVA